MMQFTTFYVGKTLFGVNILQVKEINNQMKYTPVPDSADFIKGLFNLRGQIITIFDLAKRLGRHDTDIQDKTRNLILKTDVETALIRSSNKIEEIGHDAVGFIIDRIGDVIEVEDTDIQSAPANVGDISKEFIKGVVELKDDLLIILNVQEIIKF
ncbi:MAG TPA: chemotaxis protein CheW [Candidatus Cloacimonadota bacterium]|jgi:purine-binding chemotaxis protein CheW|nr:chemotaxis protein CheW [Candidatus Cloacimonadales bacterium]HPY96865.1 chemotaxis protein CheW [Candidatus Cloacimonadota bacterium]HQB41448.1 chemotaxis protein CheW [Candidatus Cloacimonadota bacterium]